jgi:cell division protein FtsZ
MTVADVQRAVEPISRLSSRAHLIMGAAVDEAYRGRFNLTVIASANLAPRRVAQTPAARSPVARTTALRPAAPAPAAPAKKEMAQAKQENLPLDNVSRGRFDKSEPTLHNGEDLDVPTFIRRGVSLKR